MAWNGPVKIIRDRWGCPHIDARSEHDVWFAQGLCHAQDRLWQMERTRRFARGTLSEILGDALIPVDKDGYLLYQHDITGSASSIDLVDYLTTRYTWDTYIVDKYGTVTQVTTGYE